MDENPPVWLVALGANLPSASGPPGQTLARALQLLGDEDGIALSAASRFFVTPAFPAGSGPDFLNAVASLQSLLPPAVLLARLHAIEARLGRERRTRWGARTIDLDLLAGGALVLPDAARQDGWRALPPAEAGARAPAELILPHPRLQDRAFVLGPLMEVAPLWRHPRTGRTVAEMWAALPAAERAAIRPLGRAAPHRA